eukprot:CAMPEP_0169426622 /NCGR_PEP_ID=MMETSP1042-20121227/315_1 /TAXON_ID=464988 /ORGANISM="Hemiselmis andersenii, Strain CCMP1180" /LENGTH=250 /DNA_ID=CAMNT_0009536585 /DNA_START=139 /DNA_END=888 /DNA_ORIENTATION=+
MALCDAHSAKTPVASQLVALTVAARARGCDGRAMEQSSGGIRMDSWCGGGLAEQRRRTCVLRLRGGGKAFRARIAAKHEWRASLWRHAKSGHTEEIRKLVRQPLCPLDVADKEQGWTGLHWAAASGHASVVQTLLEAGADVNARDLHDSTPLHWAASLGHQAVLVVLCKGGANLHLRDKTGKTPIGVAVQHRQEYAAELLKRSLIRRWKMLSERKKVSWERRLRKDNISELERDRLMRAIKPGKALQVRL